MRALRASSLRRRLVSAVVAVALIVIMGASPALADDGRQGGQVELTAAQKHKAHDELVPVIVAQVCDASVMGKVVSLLQGGKASCGAVVASMLPDSFESLQAFQASIQGGTFCKVVSSATPPPGNVAIEGLCNMTFNKDLSAGISAAVELWWDGFLKSIGAIVDFIDFIQNPSTALEVLANSIKKDSVNALGTTLNALSQPTDFDAGDPVFRTVWAGATGLGLGVLAVMVLLTLRASAAGKIDGAAATRSLVVWTPIAVLMMVFGPVLGHVITGWLQPINEGLINWGTTPMNTAIALMGTFAKVQSTTVFGPLLGILLWGLLFIGAWATFLLMVAWKVALLLTGTGIGVALGMLANPLWRPKVMKLVGAFGGLMASKSILLFMLGAGFYLMGVGGQLAPGSDEGITQIVNIFVAGLILITVVFFPFLLLKYIPLTPESSRSSHSGGSVAGAAVMAGGASALSMSIANNRRDAINHQNTSAGNTQSTTSWTPPQEPTKLVPGGGAGYGAQSSAGPVPGAAPAMAGASSSKPAAPASGGAAAAGGGAASAGAKTTGTAAAGASTAGVAMAVQAGIAAANAAAAKTKEAAHAAAPDIPGG